MIRTHYVEAHSPGSYSREREAMARLQREHERAMELPKPIPTIAGIKGADVSETWDAMSVVAGLPA